MGSKDWEFLDHVSDGLPTAQVYEDHLNLIDESVLAEFEEEVEWGEITAEDCAHLYAGWLRDHPHRRPDFKLPPPGVIGGVVAQPSGNLGV